jgi:ADP-ribose pyrophosphatase YjhB (NUDIX family)
MPSGESVSIREGNRTVESIKGDTLGNNLFQIRVTGIMLENKKILIVKQKMSDKREWSLPGGRLEEGELLEEGISREVLEETGLKTRLVKLLFVCDKPDVNPPVLHITFLLEKISGEITLPSNEFDENPIYDVKMVPIYKLTDYGFTDKFMNIVIKEFEDSGGYCGLKCNIGL